VGRSPAKRTRQGLDGMASFIALCTFCEYHGPSVIISTQTLETPTSDEVVTADNGAVFIDCIRKLKRYQSDEEDFDTNKIRIGRTSRLSRRFSLPDGRNSVRSVCSYCSSLDAGLKALVSHGAQASFVSTQHGLGEVYGLAKDAAVKSISCEVVENRHGRILFTNGPSAATVMTQTFRLPDKNARGFHRYFSIVVGSKMRGHMVRSWPFLSQGIEDVVTLLESKCGPPLTQKDMIELAKSNETIGPQRPNPNSQSFNNLKQLTSDPSIFLCLHQKFSIILTSIASGKTEAAVIGSPVQCTLSLDESRIELLVKISSGLCKCQCKNLFYNLLSGSGLEIRSLDRESGRKVADALAVILPNNKKNDSIYFANVVLSQIMTENVNKQTRENSQNFADTKRLTTHSLVINNLTMSSFSFYDEKQCLCLASEYLQSDRSKQHSCCTCSSCDSATSSRLVTNFIHLLYRTDLSTTILHTKLLSIVEAILNKAKIWTKLKSAYEEIKCLKQFGLDASDASILSFFKLFIR